MVWGATVRERLLTQHFLQRFLENDLLSPDADHHDAIAMVCGGLLTLGLFLSVFISLKFLFMPFPSPGRTAVLAVGDRLIFVTLAMIVLAFVAVATWDALSLDPRDTAILGPLPIERAVLARAKLRAIAILAGSFLPGGQCPLERVPSHVDGRQAADRHDPGADVDRRSPADHARCRPVRLCVRSGAAGTAARDAGLALHTGLHRSPGRTHRGSGDDLSAASGHPEPRPDRHERGAAAPAGLVRRPAGSARGTTGRRSAARRVAAPLCVSGGSGGGAVSRGRGLAAPTRLARGGGPDHLIRRGGDRVLLELPLAAAATGRASRASLSRTSACSRD